MYDIPRFLFGLIIYLIIIILSFIPLFKFKLVDILMSINHYIFGFNKTIVRDYRKFKHDSKILLFQHNSYYDFYALVQYLKTQNLTCIIDSKLLKVPIMGTILKNFKCIVINKKQKNNSQKIIDYINNPQKNKYIAIAPSAGKGTLEDPIGSFKTSAFIPMKPVTPVLIRYKDNKTCWFESDNIKRWFLDIFRFRRFYTCELIILEEITAEGCKTPREFADKVEKYMKDAYNDRYI